MGVGDSIRKAADDAMKDLGGNAMPPDDGQTPEPGAESDGVQVHSSISEGSNAGDDAGDDDGGRPADEAARDSLAGDLTRSIDPDQDDPGTDPSAEARRTGN